MTNTAGTPSEAMMTPARAGPRARAPLTFTMSSRVAAANCSRGTNSVMSGCHAGSWTAPMRPMANVDSSSRGGGTSPNQLSTASSSDTVMAYTWTPISR